MGTEVKFRKGDQVRCVQGWEVDSAGPIRGCLYTVRYVEDGDDCYMIGLEELKDWGPEWSASRFVLVPVTVHVQEKSPVPDFSGSIDGTGIKSVMKSPKTPLELIPPQFTEGVASILLHGATKYAPNNWVKGMSWETVMGGILRHLSAFRRGEEIDGESNLPHLYHAACGMAFLSYYAHGPKQQEYRKFDDRVFAVKPSGQTVDAKEWSVR